MLCLRLPPAAARAGDTLHQPVTTILQRYLPAADTLPAGFSASPPRVLSNAALAAEFQNPLDLPQFLPRQRLGGLQQTITGTVASGPLAIDLELDLFAAPDGAQADVRVPLFTRLVAATALAPPPLGAASSEFLLVYGAGNGSAGRAYRLAFSVDRLELVLTASAPAGSSVEQLLSGLATRLAGAAAASPPPPVSDAELLLLARQGRPEAVLRAALQVLLQRAAPPPALQDLLSRAYDGTVAAARSAGVQDPPALPDLPNDPRQAWRAFDAAWQALTVAADGSVDAGALAYAAASAAFEGLDCASAFLPPTLVTQDFQAIEGGSGTGLGAVFSLQAPYTVLDVSPGSAAAGGGVQIGDVLLAVDGMDATGADRQLLTLMLEGGPGTPVTLTLAGPGAGSRDVTLLHGTAQAAVPAAVTLPGGAAYVRLDTLDGDGRAAAGLRRALGDPTAAGATGWVLDLRASEGADPVAAAALAALFLPQGSIVATLAGRDGDAVLRTAGAPLQEQPPLVVLLDPAGTGAAAETLAAALQDSGRATVLGMPTPGCADPVGLVNFLDGSGALLVSAHLLAGPDKLPLDGSGVTPDIIVDRTPADRLAGRDPQLDAAAALLATGTGSP